MKSSHVLFLGLLAAVGIWWMLTAPDDADAEIRARLDVFEQLLQKAPGEQALESADRARRVTELLAPEFVLRLEPIGQEIRDPAALTRPFVGLRRSVEQLEVDFHGLDIEIADDGRTAQSTMSATLQATGGDNRRGTYTVSIRWLLAREWLIEELHAAERNDGLFD
ncbi:MAG: hypothetical protein AAGM22_25195 [Acidobacteriota bacterium]